MSLHALELKIPPVAVTLVSGLLAWLLARAFPSLGMVLRGAWVVAVLLWATGAVIAALGVIAFRRARTTVNPLSPDAAATLVVTGIYRWTRNPMYLGMLLVLAGWVAFVGNGAGVLVLPAFVLYLNRFQIAVEERILTQRFGAAFTRYRTEVRRWL